MFERMCFRFHRLSVQWDQRPLSSHGNTYTIIHYKAAFYVNTPPKLFVLEQSSQEEKEKTENPAQV